MLVVIVTLTIVIFVLTIALYEKNKNAVCTSKKRLDGKTVLVTGGTSGIGYEIAKDFAQRGARVIIVCPFKEEGVAALKKIKDKSGNQNVVFQHLDLASLKSVRDFASNILANEKRLDLLVNNAGVGLAKDVFTKDGIQLAMQINYFGHFLLTILLMPLLKESAPSRVINASSILHNFGKVYPEYINSTGYHNTLQVYCNSKFCMIPFSRELTRRLKGSGVTVNCYDPGFVGTRIYESAGILAGFMGKVVLKLLYKSPFYGAQTPVYVALDDDAGKLSGELFQNCKRKKATSSAYDDDIATMLWDISVKTVALTDDELKCLC